MPTESQRTDTPPQNKWHNPWTIMVRTLVTISGAPNCLRGTAVKTLHKQTCCSFTLHSSLTRRLGQFVLLGHAIILLGLQQKWVEDQVLQLAGDERENPFFGGSMLAVGGVFDCPAKPFGRWWRFTKEQKKWPPNFQGRKYIMGSYALEIHIRSPVIP